MLNWIWLGMILIAVVVGGFGGLLGVMTKGAFEEAERAVMNFALPFIGLWAVWLGLMHLAERAGLVQALARFMRPVMRRLFPDVPEDHPAMGAMVMNMAANMIGVSNAATPLGLRAMYHLQKLNPHPGVASNAMITFLAINTASIQLLPTTSMMLLSNAGSKNFSSIVGPAFIASAIGMVAGILLSRLLCRWRPYVPEAGENIDRPAEPLPEEPAPLEIAQPKALTGWGKFALLAFFLTFAAMFYTLVCPTVVNHGVQALRDWMPKVFTGTWRFGDFWPDIGQGQRMIRALSLLSVPFLICFFPLYAALRGVKVYEEFCTGARDAFDTARRVIPFLVAMLLAIRLLRDSGVLSAFTDALRPLLQAIHFPAELLPLGILRSLSGSASLAFTSDLIKTHGPDSFIGLTAATMYGSSETTFYVIAVYFGSVGIRKTRHAVVAGLGADLVAIIATVVVCRWMFGG